jgi:hypothetical protein
MALGPTIFSHASLTSRGRESSPRSCHSYPSPRSYHPRPKEELSSNSYQFTVPHSKNHLTVLPSQRTNLQCPLFKNQRTNLRHPTRGIPSPTNSRHPLPHQLVASPPRTNSPCGIPLPQRIISWRPSTQHLTTLRHIRHIF